MNKDFSKEKLLEKNTRQQLKVLYDLARFIEVNQHGVHSDHFQKLAKYHSFLQDLTDEKIQKINKEFAKINEVDRQFQIYLMNLERFLGQSTKDYDFLVKTGDDKQIKTRHPIRCLLDSVRSAHNVGAMFRNSECFGIQEIMLTGLTPTPESAQVQKTAMGSETMLKWNYHKNAIEVIQELKEQGHIIWSIETSPQAEDINQIKQIPEKLVLIFGHEQHGVSHELLKLSDKIMQIPLYGVKNSLNVSICQGIILNSICSKLESS